jgi:hypothetical protein
MQGSFARALRREKFYDGTRPPRTHEARVALGNLRRGVEYHVAAGTRRAGVAQVQHQHRPLGNVLDLHVDAVEVKRGDAGVGAQIQGEDADHVRRFLRIDIPHHHMQ